MTLPEDENAINNIKCDVNNAIQNAKDLLHSETSGLSYDYRQRLVDQLSNILDLLS